MMCASSRASGTHISPVSPNPCGTPPPIEALREHQCLIGTGTNWHFLDRGTPRTSAPHGRWQCNSGAAIADAAISGIGICQLPLFYVRHAIASGLLVPILQELRAAPEPIWAVYPQRRHLLPKVRGAVEALEAELQGLLDR